MVLETLDKVKDVEIGAEELSDAVAQQVADIVDDAEEKEEEDHQRALNWNYSIPFAGVRYYSF